MTLHPHQYGNFKPKKADKLKATKVGDHYGRLVVTKESGRDKNGFRFDCLCDCGNTKNVSGYQLRSGKTRSCGCLQQECRRTSRRSTKLAFQTGQIFGRLTIVSDAPRKKGDGHARYVCKCECGSIIELQATYLKTGRQTSCGCEARRKTRERCTSHGMFGTPMYRLWVSMLARCRNPKAHGYHRYGGRGIKVCDRWHDFNNFYADMGERPSKEYTLGRIDNDGDYAPENVRWELWADQYRNQCTNRFLTLNGETLTLAEWGRRLGISDRTISQRLAKGWSVEDALIPRLLKRGWR